MHGHGRAGFLCGAAVDDQKRIAGGEAGARGPKHIEMSGGGEGAPAGERCNKSKSLGFEPLGGLRRREARASFLVTPSCLCSFVTNVLMFWFLEKPMPKSSMFMLIM